MSEENGWVRLPEPKPDSIPVGTRFKHSENTTFTVTSELRLGRDGYEGECISDTGFRALYVTQTALWQLAPGHRFEGSAVVKNCCERYAMAEAGGVAHVCVGAATEDNLGDTPEHLKPLLKAARERVPGALVSLESGIQCRSYFGLWPSSATSTGHATEHGLNGFGEGFGILARKKLRAAIEQGRCYPTADARRIGREEFGMKFGDDVRVKYLTDDEVNQMHTATGAELNEVARLLGTKRDVVVMNGRDMYETDATLRSRLQAIHAGNVPNPTKVLTSSPITFGGLVSPPSADEVRQFQGAVKELKIEGCIGITEIPYAGVNRACACGATSNLRSVTLEVGSGMKTMCGPCYQSKRRAELQAAKVEQLKGEMDRKVTPRWCEAPRSWPADSGDGYEL